MNRELRLKLKMPKAGKFVKNSGDKFAKKRTLKKDALKKLSNIPELKLEKALNSKAVAKTLKGFRGNHG